MLQTLKKTKDTINNWLKAYIREKKYGFSNINTWTEDGLDRLSEYMSRGKMIRGSLVLFSSDVYGANSGDAAVSVAAAMELFQAAFLIHDDIMDQDDERRGGPSVHFQYSGLGQSLNGSGSDNKLFGLSMGICLGDVAIFLGMECLAKSESPHLGRLLSRVVQDLSIVGFAQMQDVFSGFSFEEQGIEAIKSLYQHKTGRYTFSLPLASGAILAGKDESEIHKLISLGEIMGIIFQVRDDELGLFEKPKELAKSVGSDISTNKQTIHRKMLFERADSNEIDTLNSIYGKTDLSQSNLDYVKMLFDKYNIREDVAAWLEQLSAEAQKQIDALSLDKSSKEYLVELLEYIYVRTY